MENIKLSDYITYSNEELFNLVNWIGETRTSLYDIIDTTNSMNYTNDEECQYRVYHIDGYCFEVSKEEDYDEDDNFIGYKYTFSQHWEGFKNDLTPLKAAELLNQSEL